MRVLAIETSGKVGSVALLEGDGGLATLLVQRQLPVTDRTARSLLPYIKQLFDESSWRPGDVEMVCIATGPGSFTGLRIGVVTAKTFAYATGARLAGVHTLAAMAAGVTSTARRLWTVLDAQRQELFVAMFALDRPIIDQSSPDTEILSVPQWLQRLASGDVVAGPPLAKLRDQLPCEVTVMDEATWNPSAAAVGQLGVQLVARGENVEPLELVPRYFRKSAAEEKAASQFNI